jgi:hypothetical protein
MGKILILCQTVIFHNFIFTIPNSTVVSVNQILLNNADLLILEGNTKPAAFYLHDNLTRVKLKQAPAF